MPGIDPEEGFDINPNTVMLARDHPDFQELVDTSDSDSLWISVDGPASLGVGPIKVQLGHTKTVFDIRKILQSTSNDKRTGKRANRDSRPTPQGPRRTQW